MEYNKLVRDNVPDVLQKKGIGSETHVALEEEYEEKLRDKLLEEVHEYLGDPNTEELADILEVVYALSALHNTTIDDLETLRKDKANERGGFSKKIILENTDN